jgi:hypothetical protein
MDDMDRADGLFQIGLEAALEHMKSIPRMSSLEIAGHIADLDAEIKRSKEAGETCPNIGEDFDRAIRDLKDARERINELAANVSPVIGNRRKDALEWLRDLSIDLLEAREKLEDVAEGDAK